MIALAALAGVDFLVSWNYQQIVRLDMIRKFDGVNLELGYRAVAIYFPREMTAYEREVLNRSLEKWLGAYATNSPMC